MMSHDPFVQAWLAQAGKPPQAAQGIGMGVGQGVGMGVGQGMIGAKPQPPAAPAPNPNDPTAPVAVTPQQGTPSDAQHPVMGALRDLFAGGQGGQGGQGGGQGGLQFGGQGGDIGKVMNVLKMFGIGA